MKGLYFILILFITVWNIQAQDLKGIKSIIQYEDTIIRKISILDTNGNIIFWKNNKLNGPVVMVGTSHYDNSNRKIKTISGHSNVGFSIWEHEFDSAGNEIKTIAYNELPENEDGYRFNPYIYIEDFNSIKDIENDTIVMKMSNSGQKHIVFEHTYDNNGNEIMEVLFEDNGDTSGITTNTYDENGNRIRSHYKRSIGEWIIKYSFDTNGNEISTKRINDKGDTIFVILCKYDKNDNLIEDLYLNRGVKEYTEKYFYKKELMTKKEICNSDDVLVRVQTYKYNDKGNITREDYHDIEDNKKIVYNWEYEYY